MADEEGKNYLRWSDFKLSDSMYQKYHISLILDTILNTGEVSRKSIADLTGLFRSTVTKYTRQMLEEKQLIPRTEVKNPFGPPEKLLQLNKEYQYGIGFSYSEVRDTYKVLICDYTGNYVKHMEYKADFPNSYQTIITILKKIKTENTIAFSGITFNSRFFKSGYDKKIIYSGCSSKKPYVFFSNENLKEVSQILSSSVQFSTESQAALIAESWSMRGTSVKNTALIYSTHAIKTNQSYEIRFFIATARNGVITSTPNNQHEQFCIPCTVVLPGKIREKMIIIENIFKNAETHGYCDVVNVIIDKLTEMITYLYGLTGATTIYLIGGIETDCYRTKMPLLISKKLKKKKLNGINQIQIRYAVNMDEHVLYGLAINTLYSNYKYYLNHVFFNQYKNRNESTE